MDSSFRHVLIAGANGAVGTLFCGKLSEAGCDVTAVDLAPAARPGVVCARYVSADVRVPQPELFDRIERCDLVVFALPGPVAAAAWPAVAAHLGERALFVDTLSVKTPFCSMVRGCLPPGEVLSVNPMFSPTLGFGGNSVAAVCLKDGPRTRAFVDLITSWGARVVALSEERHDRTAAILQVATHASILAFGLALQRIAHEPSEVAALMTPPHRAMLDLLARITRASPEVYWEIQRDNPFAAEARSAVAAGLADLSAMLAGDDFQAFRAALESMRAGPQNRAPK